MKVSSNIAWIKNDPEQWGFYKNRSYPVMIQKADKNRVYNTNRPGIIYNILEDSYAESGDGYVVTGIAGEMWPIPKTSLDKYDISPDAVTYEPVGVYTIEQDVVYAGIRIPTDERFVLETDQNGKTIFKGNRPGIGHDAGDYILVAAKPEDGAHKPDFSDSGRIVNGMIFDRIYRKIL